MPIDAVNSLQHNTIGMLCFRIVTLGLGGDFETSAHCFRDELVAVLRRDEVGPMNSSSLGGALSARRVHGPCSHGAKGVALLTSQFPLHRKTTSRLSLVCFVLYSMTLTYSMRLTRLQLNSLLLPSIRVATLLFLPLSLLVRSQ